MPIAEHEPVPVRPGGVSRIVAEVSVPQGHRDVRHSHRHAGVTGARMLDGIHGEDAQSRSEVLRCNSLEVLVSHLTSAY